MQQLPKIVPSRLQRRTLAREEKHPDADQLTAFSEQSLPADERGRMMEHLSRCGDCREIVALALPGVEALPQNFALPARSSWLNWPSLRWSFVAAGILLVTSLGVLQYQQRQQRGTELTAKMVEPEKTRESASQNLPPSSESGTPVPQREYGSVEQTQAKVDVTGRAKAGQQHALPLRTVIRPVSPAPHSRNQGLALAQPLDAFEVVGKAKDAVPEQTASASGSGFAPQAPNLQTSPSLMKRASPRWTISPAGVLERSFDAGVTWEEVKITSDATANGPERNAVAANGAAQPNSNQNLLSNSDFIFRAVSAIGPEIWAGGSSAALFHSIDSGAHWIRVFPAASDVVLTGDIVGIEFADPQHGRVATATQETWITADDGQSWTKQP